jgi:hypothetical protein
VYLVSHAFVHTWVSVNFTNRDVYLDAFTYGFKHKREAS